MKASFESLQASTLQSFLVRKFEEKAFSAPYHFHPEFELTYIVTGTGKRYVGSHMQDFCPGDFVMLGAHLPHCWKSGETKRGEKSSSVVIQFLPQFLGDDFFAKPELTSILRLLQRSSNGIHFTGSTDVYKGKMNALLEEANSFKRLIQFLDLLHELSMLRRYTLLDKQKKETELSDTEQQRIHAVMAYIIDNFKHSVSLTQAASVINMTPHSFCRYFKKITRKTFIEAVTDYRIDYSAQQLIDTQHPISQIGFDSGFNDISNFYKTFRERMKQSPLSYRNTFLKEKAEV